jgi:hypothetical protein
MRIPSMAARPLALFTAAILGCLGLVSMPLTVAAASPDARNASAAQVVTAQAWGDNSAGELGNGTFTQEDTPVAVGSLSGVKAISSGGRDNLALLSSGTVMAWGDNNNGQLGNGTTANSDVPVAVTGLTKVKAVAAGYLFSVAVLTNGTVMAWGYNGNGQLGDGTYTNSDVPVAVTGLTGASAVAAGGQFAVALLSNGTAMSWGDNESGQLGDGNENSGSSNVPVAVDGLTGATQISAGNEFALAVVAKGTVMGWGDNSFNELAQSNGFPGGISNSDVPIDIPGVGASSAVAAGGFFGLALLTNGTVLGWGDNAFGQLGNGTTNLQITPAAVSGLTAVRAISAGSIHAAALISSTGPPALTSTPSIWKVSHTPDLGGATVSDYSFAAVSAASTTSAWAVGTKEVTADRPLAEQWNGTAWSNVAIPVPADTGQASFSGVDDLSSTSAWAVGDWEETGSTMENTLIEHWNGTAWSIVPSPNPGGTTSGSDSELTSIAGTGPDDLWAAGSFDIGGAFNAVLLEHWNGTAWSAVAPPDEDGEEFATAVTAVSSTDVWVVGDEGFDQATLADRWNGTTWTVTSTPTLQTTDSTNFLTGVSADGADNIWASGYEGNVNDANFAQPYMLHWNGTAWTLTQLPNAGSEGSTLLGTTVLSPTDVWAVGRTGESDGGALTLSEHYNGAAWSVSSSLDPGQLSGLPQNTLTAVGSLSGGLLWAVGTQEIPGECCLRTLALGTASG